MEKRSVLILFLFLSLIGCGINSSNSKLFESFFVGENGIQYFIKPLEFKGDNKTKLLMDITIRMKNVNENKATVNFSIIDQKIITIIDSMIITQPNQKILLHDIEPLFFEKQKNRLVARYTSKANSEKIISYFKRTNWNIYIYSVNEKYDYVSSVKTDKKIQYINANLFSIF